VLSYFSEYGLARGLRKLWVNVFISYDALIVRPSRLISYIHIFSSSAIKKQPSPSFISLHCQSFLYLVSEIFIKMLPKTSVFALSFLVASCSAVPPNFKRDISTNVTLYAYGTNISGLALYYGNPTGTYLLQKGTPPSHTHNKQDWHTSVPPHQQITPP
jgi:hypothetical protein